MASAGEVLLDTTILVDLLRRFSPAETWLHTCKNFRFYISDIVVLELHAGCRNTQEKERLDRFCSRFDPLHLVAEDTMRAVEMFRRFRLSHGVGILDVLIAAPAARLGIPLLSSNLKHFEFLPDIRVERPCS